jgi:2-polyprenyl-6-methoxyphenol hydroxylase-like FAD-dependent oxidoreductase
MHDVIVVGGGPTGFVTALGLAQVGVSVCLIEAEAGINASPRACVYHWSMLDGLERLGIREEAERIGYTKDDYLWLVKRTGERLPYDLKVLSSVTPFPYNIQLGQDRLAEICHGRLEAMAHAQVHWNTAFTGLVEDADGVTVTASTPDGPIELRARWVIGADGAGSAVRKALGLSFDGMTWPERFVATNLRHDFESGGYWQSTMVVDEEWGAVIVKITRDGLWRCTFMEQASLPEETYLERAARGLSAPAAGAGRLRTRPGLAVQDAPALRGELPQGTRAAGRGRRARDQPDRRVRPDHRAVRRLRAVADAGGGRARRRRSGAARCVGRGAAPDLPRQDQPAGLRLQGLRVSRLRRRGAARGAARGHARDGPRSRRAAAAAAVHQGIGDDQPGGKDSSALPPLMGKDSEACRRRRLA